MWAATPHSMAAAMRINAMLNMMLFSLLYGAGATPLATPAWFKRLA